MKKLMAVLALVGLGLVSVESAHAGVRNYDLEPNFGFRVALQYAHNDIAASDGTANIPIAGRPDTSAGDQANTEYVMPFAGRIIGYSVRSNAALTAGLAHFDIAVNGTNVTANQTSLTLKSNEGTSTASTTTQQAYLNLVDRTTRSTSISFAAGDRIGVSMRTEAGTVGARPSPTTADLVVTVIVDQNAQE